MRAPNGTLGLGARWLGLLWFTIATVALAGGDAAKKTSTSEPEDFFAELEYRYVGPLGNRVLAVVGVRGDPNVIYAGSASGGIFKTTDGGVRWSPVFDDQPAASIGSLAIAPSDPNVIWAGTGETFLRANVSIGNGVYRSTDAGKTWTHLGLDRTGRIGRVIVDPRDPDVAWVAALGHCYGPQPERGVYRTRDAGKTWERVLFVDESTGASDLAVDPNNPRILFAGMWQVQIDTFSRTSGGPGSSLWMSRDGGDTWKRLEGHGLPDPPWGKIGLSTTADDSSRVYALIETSSNRDFAPFDEYQGSLWRTDDGGDTWNLATRDLDAIGRPLYYTRAVASPDDRDEIHFMSPDHTRSLDGGHHIDEKVNAGWDHHDMWIDPLNADRLLVGYDGGVAISVDRGRTWYHPQLPNAQMYHVDVDDRVPYWVYGNRQDGFAARGPSNSLTGDELPVSEWHSIAGCEVGFAIPSPVGDVVWSGCYEGILDLYELETGHSRTVTVWPDAIEGTAASELEYRFQWDTPLAISPHDPSRVYAGSQFVHRTTDFGQTWTVISPDLTTDNPDFERRTGGLTLDDASPTVGPSVFAIAESPVEEGLIWAGTSDGLVQLTRDGGATWTDVTAHLPGLPPLGTIANVEPSPHAAGTAYLTVDRHQRGDNDPYVYKTADWGATWKRIDAGVPRSFFSTTYCVREDPKAPGMLYLGTENGVWVSGDDGAHWRELRANLPHAPVHWLTVQRRFDDLVVATYGRGIWILDDLGPLRQLRPQLAEEPTAPASEAALLEPRPAYRFYEREPRLRQPDVPAAGKNPKYGALIHYVLPEEIGEDEKLELAFLDDHGTVVRTLDPEKLERGAGLHRVVWDLRYDKTEEVELRTRPLDHPHFPMPDEGWRKMVDGERIAVLAPPGTYTVRWTVGEATRTQPLVVLKDPNATGSAEDLAAQMEIVFGLRDLQNQAAKMINELEWGRRQLEELRARLDTGDGADADVLADVDQLSKTLTSLEDRFFDLRLTGRGQDDLRTQRRVYARLSYVAATFKADFPPTAAQGEVYDVLKNDVESLRRDYEAARGEVDEFNRRLGEKELTGVVLESSPPWPPSP